MKETEPRKNGIKLPASTLIHSVSRACPYGKECGEMGGQRCPGGSLWLEHCKIHGLCRLLSNSTGTNSSCHFRSNHCTSRNASKENNQQCKQTVMVMNQYLCFNITAGKIKRIRKSNSMSLLKCFINALMT